MRSVWRVSRNLETYGQHYGSPPLSEMRFSEGELDFSVPSYSIRSYSIINRYLEDKMIPGCFDASR
jgi:hypothetical protein